MPGGLGNIASCTMARKLYGKKHSASVRYVDGLFIQVMFFGSNHDISLAPLAMSTTKDSDETRMKKGGTRPPSFYLRYLRDYLSSTMRSMRRSGSAAPHSSWSPTVKAEMYSGPMDILRTRPTGMVRLPVTAAGVRSRIEASRVFGTNFTHWLSLAMMSLISSSGTSFFSLMVSACEWQRIAPMRTHRPSTGMIGAAPGLPLTE